MIDDLDFQERYDEGLDDLDRLDIPDVDIEYQEQDDSGCEGGACRI